MNSAYNPPKITIQNVVASAMVEQEIDLHAIVNAIPNVEYRPEVFPGLALKIRHPKSCILIFNTGKMVCTGTKSVDESFNVVKRVVDQLRKAGIISTDKFEFKVQNIVASVDLGDVTIDIERVVYMIRKRIMYEPEQFPGAIYRMEDPKVVFLIFSSGKLVCAGAKKEEEVYRAVDKLISILKDVGGL
ncbi:TATA box-binding protein [Candidatus Bathyarchaeota archaeon]|nr:MAG: TATA box-binding protein [Candidatus Bathyarchaeota archaeon]